MIDYGLQTEELSISKQKPAKRYSNSQLSNLGDLFALKEDEDEI